MHDPTPSGAAMYDWQLGRTPANAVPLSPLSFLARSAAVYPDKAAVVHGDSTYSYAEFAARCRRMASALARRDIGRCDTVAVLAPNVPPMLEAHYGVPMAGAVLNALNTRLDAATIAFILDHAEAKLLLLDRELASAALEAIARLGRSVPIVLFDDPLWDGARSQPVPGAVDYEDFLAEGDPDAAGAGPADEWDAIALNYTSGTTGNPKGVVYHHRGAYLNALGDVVALALTPSLVYLWTLPMFHCNGWCFTWAVTAVGGTHVCLRRVDPALVYPMIRRHGVTHMCGAPVVLNLLANAPEAVKVRFDRTVEIATGGAAPPSPIIAAMERSGFRVTHLYGLTETFGPATICAWQSAWDGLDGEGRARMVARQGVVYPTFEALMVADPQTLQELPWDGRSMGELMLRGNTVAKGYLKNPKATAEAFAGGWFHTGDLAVRHPDGYVEIKDRAKDIIITGGENVSSLEVEEALYRHPAVLEAAVVARPDPFWGETVCAFVALKDGAATVGAEAITAWCRGQLAHFKAPRTVVFGPLPKTATGKIQKFVLRERARTLSE
jgi:fatty-acyl-CoA synthase